MGLLPPYYVRLAVGSGLGSVTKFFFIIIIFFSDFSSKKFFLGFFFWLESRTDNFLLLFNLRVFLIL